MSITKRTIFSISAGLQIIVISAYLALALFIAYQAEKDTKTKADVIVVLGARSYIKGNYNPCLVARVAHAAELYKKGYAPYILVTGGYDKEDNTSEAETMKKIALEKGVPEKAIILEKESTSTYENFTHVKPILKKKELHSVLLVTEPFHMARAMQVAEKLGYIFSVSPATQSSCWQPYKYPTKYFLKEPFAVTMYKLQNKL